MAVYAGQTYDGYPEDTEGSWIVDAAKAVVGWLGDRFIGTGYPKDLPPPLTYSVSQVAAMLTRYPAVARELRALIARQGHGPCSWPVHPLTTSSCGGQPPATSRYDTVSELAALAMWYANGTGDDLSHNEDEMRQLIVQGMGAMQTGTTPAPSGEPDTVDILVATAASEGREAAERLAADLAAGVYSSIPQSWRDAIERGLADYYAGQAGGALRGNLVPILIGGGLILALLRRAS